MSIIGSNILAGAAGSGVSAYEIEQSLRFDGSSSLSRTGAASTSGGISLWVKFSRVATAVDTAYDPFIYYRQGPIVYKTSASGTFNYPYVRIGGDAGPNAGGDYSDNSKAWRDPSAWYHIFLKINSSSQATLYVNNQQWIVNNNTVGTGSDVNYIGRDLNYHAQYYLAEYHAVFGTSVDPTDFGEYDDNGVWRPIEYTGSHGSNGYYLKFDPSATNGIGHDHSGNGNHFTATGFTTSGTGTDVMSDTPTTNYATLNPLNPGVTQLANGNLDYSGSAYQYVRSTQVMSGDKYYFEVTTTEANINVGIMDVATAPSTITALGSPVGYGIKSRPSGPAYTYKTQLSPATDTSISPQMAANDVLGFSVDLVNGTLSVSRNGSGTDWGTLFTGIDTTKSFYVYAGHESAVSSTVFQINFGQRAFAYTPPTGFKALNTSNLPAPDIADGSEYFNTVLYTGDNSEQSITGVGFQPDFAWIRRRNGIAGHCLQDAVRGVQKFLTADSDEAEYTSSGTIISFDSDGFTLGAGNPLIETNNTGGNFVAWNWLASNTSGSSNTDGDITSTVSANQTAGFSIVTYAGSGTGGDSIGHGLGVPPKMIIAKSRGGGPYPTASWAVYHESIGASKSLALDTTAAAAGPYSNPGTIWYNTTPTSTVFYVGNLNETNGSNNYVAYCFAEVEGYSKFGKYVSNNSADGPFVFCGFKPELVWLKKTSGSSNWFMYDAARNEYNVTGNKLYADSSAAENGEDGGSTTSNTIDILSNGFKLRTNNGTNNGGDYIFCAWAQHPFGGSDISPATAR